MVAIKKYVNVFSYYLYKGVEIVSVLMLLSVVLIVSLEVLMRYVFNQGFPWILEIGTLLLQYIAFASMVLGFKYRLHIALVALYNKFPALARKILDKFIYTCILFFGIVTCIYGYQLTTSMWRFILPATEWPQGLTYLICVVTGAIIIFEATVSLLGLNDPDVKWTAAEPPASKTETAGGNDDV